MKVSRGSRQFPMPNFIRKRIRDLCHAAYFELFRRSVTFDPETSSVSFPPNDQQQHDTSVGQRDAQLRIMDHAITLLKKDAKDFSLQITEEQWRDDDFLHHMLSEVCSTWNLVARGSIGMEEWESWEDPGSFYFDEPAFQVPVFSQESEDKESDVSDEGEDLEDLMLLYQGPHLDAESGLESGSPHSTTGVDEPRDVPNGGPTFDLFRSIRKKRMWFEAFDRRAYPEHGTQSKRPRITRPVRNHSRPSNEQIPPDRSRPPVPKVTPLKNSFRPGLTFTSKAQRCDACFKCDKNCIGVPSALDQRCNSCVWWAKHCLPRNCSEEEAQQRRDAHKARKLREKTENCQACEENGSECSRSIKGRSRECIQCFETGRFCIPQNCPANEIQFNKLRSKTCRWRHG